MNQPQFEDKRLDKAWQEVEHVFKHAGMAIPAPGFVTRWRARLALERQKEERKQAGLMIAAILIIAFGFILLIGLQILPNIGAKGNLLSVWVEMVTRVVVLVRMVAASIGTLSRTLPGVIPTSWMISSLMIMAGVVALWVTLVSQIQKQGVTQHEKIQ